MFKIPLKKTIYSYLLCAIIFFITLLFMDKEIGESFYLSLMVFILPMCLNIALRDYIRQEKEIKEN